MARIETAILMPGTPEISVCARWRVAAFNDVLGRSFEEEHQTLETFAADQSQQVGMVAFCDGVAAGTCLLVPSEIEPVHAVSPWLAGLFVEPEHRRLGIGRMLVRAIEDQARLRGHVRLYLYTDGARPFYEQLGWSVIDRADWMGSSTALMSRELSWETLT